MVQLKSVTLNLGFVSVTFEENELDKTLAALLAEMRNITSDLNLQERETLRAIMSAKKDIKVIDIFPEFRRNTNEHETLRKLRDAQFIKPAEGGQWKLEKGIMVKPFGRLMWDKVGEDKLFSN